MTDRGWARITGGARRIGAALALAAAEQGYDLLIHHRQAAEDAEAVAVQARAKGRQVRVVAADLADTTTAPAMITAAPGPVTLLVNCASVFTEDRIDTLTVGGWDAVMSANLRGPVLLAQAFAAALPADRQGLIVNVTDQRVWRLNPNFFSYTLSKSALWTATQTLAQALAPRIRVNAIGPGPTLPSVHQTPEDFAAEAASVPLNHGASTGEIAAALSYFINAPSVTGQMIAVDGGQHLAWRTPDVVGAKP